MVPVPFLNGEPPLSEIEQQGLYAKTMYIPYNNLPVGLAYYKNLLFITVPRRRIGVPATLSVINIDQVAKNEISPKLSAYPNYDINEIPVSIIISTYLI